MRRKQRSINQHSPEKSDTFFTSKSHSDTLLEAAEEPSTDRRYSDTLRKVSRSSALNDSTAEESLR
jgi:hypothetical protein